MGSIQTSQPGGIGVFTGSGSAFPGIGLIFSYLGATTTYSWSLTSVPGGSAASMKIGPAGTGKLSPDVLGIYGVRFTDSSSGTTDVNITVVQDGSLLTLYLGTGTRPETFKLADTSGTTGKTLALKGSDTDVANIGGQIRMQPGLGFDSNGFVVSEGEGNADHVQCFGEGRINPKISIIGSGIAIWESLAAIGEFRSSGDVYLDALGGTQFARVGAGLAIVYRLGANGMRLSTDAVAPVERLEVGGNSSLEGALRLKALPVSNLSGGGALGTSAATVDIYTNFDVNQTTAGQTLTIPNPTTATSGRLALVSNVGSQTFTMLGATVATGGTLMARWTGAAWSKVS